MLILIKKFTDNILYTFILTQTCRLQITIFFHKEYTNTYLHKSNCIVYGPYESLEFSNVKWVLLASRHSPFDLRSKPRAKGRSEKQNSKMSRWISRIKWIKTNIFISLSIYILIGFASTIYVPDFFDTLKFYKIYLKLYRQIWIILSAYNRKPIKNNI